MSANVETVCMWSGSWVGMTVLVPCPSALAAYESLAPSYDALTADYDHERWLAALEAVARRWGLRGRRLLDVACGTGHSFAPMLGRGYDVTACDLSPAMVARAQTRHPAGRQRVFVADMRRLPEVGRFDLVTCLDDAINYLHTSDELRATFASVARVLAPKGVYVFDVNTLRTYQETFGRDAIMEREGTVLLWRTRRRADVAPGDSFAVTVESFTQEEGHWRRSGSRHVQRHHPAETVRAQLAAAGLECLDVLGQRPGAQLSQHPDEGVHHKLVFVARRATQRHHGERKEVTHDRQPDRQPVAQAAHRTGSRASADRSQSQAAPSCPAALGAALAPPHGVRAMGVPLGGHQLF